ncbi:hypothetical protein [Phaffia rhodozyma]|uniref:Uncharacterized protein n=1 Tax=Phaffia rhodozyma TaxID=264483 RepID=A0A0F7SS00_PHARH|nr:hypothetical protein [Phaffia rhodozyma]
MSSSSSPLDQLITQGVTYIKSAIDQNPAVSQIISQTSIAPFVTAPSSPAFLPLIPLLAATSQLTFSLSEFLSLRPLVQPHREKDIPGKAIQSYFEGWWVSGTVTVGAGLALSHFAFVPSVAPIIKLLVYGNPKDTRGLTGQWLRIHALRTAVVDLPAFLCFLFALY